MTAAAPSGPPRLARLFSLLALALAACGAPPPDGELDEALFANDKTAYEFFVSKGLTSFQAAGIVGNLDQESGCSPTAIQPGGPGRGIAQWSVGGRWDSSFHDNVVWYASTKGVSPWSLGLQLEFIWYELTTFGYGFSKLKATTNVTDATLVFMADYEICGNCLSTQRVSYAKQVLAAYGSTPAWGASFVSQSWPPASSPLNLVVNQSAGANIVLKNVGTKSWSSLTRLGTTMPRDRKSVFVASDWVSASRPAECKAGAAPGATCKFAFTFQAPDVPGDYKEYFGVVEEGVTWFSAPGEGGPPDNQIEAWIHVAQAQYHGQFVSQSYPLVSAGGVVHVPQGETVTGWIDLKNVGTATWKAGVTKLAPTPRDKPSVLAATDWLGATRVSTPTADVAPGASFKFPLSIHGKTAGTTITQTFSLVEENVTWFADAPKGGGPSDTALEVKVVVGPPLPPPDLGGTRDGGADLTPGPSDDGPPVVPPSDDAGSDDAATFDDDGGFAPDDLNPPGDDGGAPTLDAAPRGIDASVDAGTGRSVSGGCGCSTSQRSPAEGALSFAVSLGLAALALAIGRRRRR